MESAGLLRMGTDLDIGATQEDTQNRGLNVVSDEPQLKLAIDNDRDIFDQTRDDHFIRRDGRVFAGTHLIIEVVDGVGLDDQARIEGAMSKCVSECGATLLHLHTHRFSPQGVSGVAVLAESHISVHTWPEIGYGAFDVFMCGDAQPWKAVDVLREAFCAGDVRVKELFRGEGIVEAAL